MTTATMPDVDIVAAVEAAMAQDPGCTWEFCGHDATWYAIAHCCSHIYRWCEYHRSGLRRLVSTPGHTRAMCGRCHQVVDVRTLTWIPIP